MLLIKSQQYEYAIDVLEKIIAVEKNKNSKNPTHLYLGTVV
jgi:hypothetical protein